MRVWQAVVFFSLAAVAGRAEDVGAQFGWVLIRAEGRAFSPELAMMDSERDQYATNFANLAAGKVAAAKASPASLEQARRLISLALHLSPRNKRAVVVNFQLSQSILPEPVASDFGEAAMARLIFTRAGLLAKQEGEENSIVARMFTRLAAELDPKNEDAVYASEVQRLEKGEVDWSLLTRPREAVQTSP